MKESRNTVAANIGIHDHPCAHLASATIVHTEPYRPLEKLINKIKYQKYKFILKKQTMNIDERFPIT